MKSGKYNKITDTAAAAKKMGKKMIPKEKNKNIQN